MTGCLFCTDKASPPGARCRHCGRKGTIPKHRCHAVGCIVEVPPRLLMCKSHWMMVPRAVQRRVWVEYVPGQENRKDPTRAYLDVMKEAIDAVAKAEGRQ